MRYVVEFDDFCDNVVETLEILKNVKAQVPGFKATLFAIPMRTSASSITLVEGLNALHSRPWIALAPHGWRHTKGECLSWTLQETKDKLAMAHEMGIDAPIFKAPAWLIAKEVYRGCTDLDYVIADHLQYRLPCAGSRVYTYNSPHGKQPKTRSIHGHLTPVTEHQITKMYEDGGLKFHQMASFLWPWEAAVENPLKVEE